MTITIPEKTVTPPSGKKPPWLVRLLNPGESPPMPSR